MNTSALCFLENSAYIRHHILEHLDPARLATSKSHVPRRVRRALGEIRPADDRRDMKVLRLVGSERGTPIKLQLLAVRLHHLECNTPTPTWLFDVTEAVADRPSLLEIPGRLKISRVVAGFSPQCDRRDANQMRSYAPSVLRN